MTEPQIANYRAALKQAREEFKLAQEKRDYHGREGFAAIDEMTRLRRTITALAAMCGEHPLVDPLGITEAVTEVMQAAEDRSLDTANVVRQLEEIGFDTESQQNISASVHAVLSRLATRGIIQKVVDKDSKVFRWKWKGKLSELPKITDEDIPL
jgi:hypothetical protein